jgi:tripartite-type tricarboxylate transporter receptor subunit TctC
LSAWQATILAFALAGSAGFAQAQDYPARPVRIVVPYAAGGGTDAIARILAKGLEQRLGAPFVIENRGGSGTTLGGAAVARAEPDGYTLLMATSSTLAMAAGLYKKLPYDPTRDFTPISLIATVPSCSSSTPRSASTRSRRSSSLPGASPASSATRPAAWVLLITSTWSCSCT